VPALGARCEGIEPVFEIFERAACRTVFCHDAGTGELDFRTPEQLHESMVGVAASGEGCKELNLPRVQPGDPEHSLLLIKLRQGPPGGKIMPPAAIQALTPQDIQVVSDWTGTGRARVRVRVSDCVHGSGRANTKAWVSSGCIAWRSGSPKRG
jgi:hypothetical protein